MASAYTGMPEGSVELAFVRSPVDLFQRSPELFLAEALVYLTFIVGCLHAGKNGPQHTLFLAIAFAAASFVDPFCLISEQIRNYFHSHASLLMWDRHVAPWQFPLFACIAYVPGAMVWMLNLRSLVAETCLVVFVSSWSFYCFDLFACRWLLYQWHVSDPLYAARTECVPLASSMWVCTYAATASLLSRVAFRYSKSRMPATNAEPQTFDLHWWGLFAVCVLVFLPLHIVPISVLYFPSFYFQLDKEYQVVWGFGLGGLVVAVVANLLSNGSATGQPDKYKGLALLQSAIWFSGLAIAIFTIDPKDVVSTSVHQPYGGKDKTSSALCEQMETYLFGMSERKRYVCDEDLMHWRIEPDPRTKQMPSPRDEWYTIRGNPMDDGFYYHYTASLLAGVVIHLLLFAVTKAKGDSFAKTKTS